MTGPRRSKSALYDYDDPGLILIGHHKPGSNMFDEPLFRDSKAPTSVEAMLLREFEKAIKGDRRALKLLIKRLTNFELTQMRKRNNRPEMFQLNECKEFERIDDVLKLLGIMIDNDHPRYREAGVGLADWAFDAAKARPDSSKRAVNAVSRWIERGCRGGLSRFFVVDREWTWCDDDGDWDFEEDMLP